MHQYSLWLKLSLASALFLLLMWLMHLFNFYQVFSPLAKEIEAHNTAKEIERVRSVLKHEANGLKLLALDWAVWDDTYEFVQNRNERYVNSNLSDSSLRILRLDAFFFYNLNYEVVWGKTWNHEKGLPLHLSQLPLNQAPAKNFLNQLTSSHPDADLHNFSGLINTDAGVMLISTYPIVDSDYHEEPRGVLVMGRLVQGKLLQNLHTITNTAFSLQSLAGPNIAPRLSYARQQMIDTNDMYVDYLSDDYLLAYALLKDIAGKPSVILEMQLEREVMPLVQATLSHNLIYTLVGLALAVILFTWLIFALIVRPIRKLDAFISVVTEATDTEEIDKPSLPRDEIGHLGRRFCEVIDQLRKRTIELRELSLKDELTNIANRRRGQLYLEEQWELAKDNEEALSVLICDIDHFKSYNDHYGHSSGDAALKEVAAALERSANKRNDLVARFGGEEFLIVLPKTNGEEAEAVAARIVKDVENLEIPHRLSPTSKFVTISCGIGGSHARDELSLKDLMSKADGALYQAKSNGRNQYSTG